MVITRYASHALLMLILCVGAQAMHEVSRRMLDIELALRHADPPPEHEADFAFPQTEKTLLMSTPCHPEIDGYFGGTSGQPLTLQYGFLMETAIHGDIHTALEAIDEFVMDSILSNIFPEVCGDQRRLQNVYEKGRATGFKFNSETIDMDRACQPTSNNMNYCAVYSSNIMMYGRDLESYETADTVLGYAREAIYASLAFVSENGVVRLIVDDELTKATGLNNVEYDTEYAGDVNGDFDMSRGGNEEEDHFSKGAKVGLAISVLALLASLVGFFLYMRMNEKAGSNTRRTRSERSIQKSDGTSFFTRLLAHGSSGSRTSETNSNESLQPSLHIQDGVPVFSQYEPRIRGSTVSSVTGSRGGGDKPIEHSIFLVDDVDSFLDEPEHVDSFLHSLPDDDPDDDMYLEAFR